ncbi:MAG: hypothetical protein PHW04_02795 [Candidatus Wallbacteria bacterium]|nr:hypothetical protein [Candidatus Wallbacteria bacterium]
MKNLEKVIRGLVRPLVVTGAFKDESSAVKEMVMMLIEKKLASFREVIEKNTGKYGEFTKFSADIQNRATIDDEDIWMEWKSAIEMNRAWEEARRDLIRCNA